MGFTPRPASGHTRPHDATIMYHQNIQCKVGVTGTGADATFVMKNRIKKIMYYPRPAHVKTCPRARAPRSPGRSRSPRVPRAPATVAHPSRWRLRELEIDFLEI